MKRRAMFDLSASVKKFYKDWTENDHNARKVKSEYQQLLEKYSDFVNQIRELPENAWNIMNMVNNCESYRFLMLYYVIKDSYKHNRLEYFDEVAELLLGWHVNYYFEWNWDWSPGKGYMNSIFHFYLNKYFKVTPIDLFRELISRK